MRPRRAIAWPAFAALALGPAAGCGETLRERYTLEIVGPIDRDYFAGAATVALDVGGREVARASYSPTGFDLRDTGVTVGDVAAIRVRAYDVHGAIVAQGETPVLELVKTSGFLRVFVQRPGTFAPSRPLRAPPVKQHVMLPALSLARAPQLSITAPLFGTGKYGLTDANDAPIEVVSDVYFFYNPLLHEDIGAEIAAPDAARKPRFGAAAVALPDPDNRNVVFGGLTRDGDGTERATSQLDVFNVYREGATFAKEGGVPRFSSEPAIARAFPALAFAGKLFAFGGRGGDPADVRDSIVVFDLDAATETEALRLSDTRLLAPRVGHTATAVAGLDGPEVLVVGGAGSTGAAVAEVFVPAASLSITPTGDLGPARADHAALLLPGDAATEDRVLIAGGRDPAGAPLRDIRIYHARARAFADAGVTLATARSGAAAFVIGGDLVIAGGIGSDGGVLPDAEIFSVGPGGIAPVTIEPCAPRARAGVAVLPNRQAIVIGGEDAAGAPVAAVEIYQPRLAR